MSAAVLFRNVSKKFIRPGIPHPGLKIAPAGKHAGSHSFGLPMEEVFALKGLTARIEEGEIYGVIGASGSGKSTLIRLLATLLKL